MFTVSAGLLFLPTGKKSRDIRHVLLGERSRLRLHSGVPPLPGLVRLECRDDVLWMLAPYLRDVIAWISVEISWNAVTAQARLSLNFSRSDVAGGRIGNCDSTADQQGDGADGAANSHDFPFLHVLA